MVLGSAWTQALLNAAVGMAFLIAIFVPLERAFTARPQRHLRRELALNLSFFALQYLLMLSVVLAFNGWLQLKLGAPGSVGWVAAIHRLPLALQVLLAVVLGDLVLYWAHRLSHAVPVLWRFHSVHHSVETLDWLAAHREHPLDGLYSQLWLNLPACLLGIDLGAVMPVLVLRGLWAVFIHSNLTIPLGPLGLILGDPVLHRWHHARVERAQNFANLAPYLDVIFGTHHRPTDEAFALGIPGQAPRSFARHLLGPFLPLESARRPRARGAAAASETVTPASDSLPSAVRGSG